MEQSMVQVVRFLSIFAGALSLFILAQTPFDFELSAAFAVIVDYYKAFVYPVVGIVEEPLTWLLDYTGWTLPVGWQNIVIVYIVLARAFYRFAHDLPRKPGGLARATAALLWPICYWIFLVINRRALSKVELARQHDGYGPKTDRSPADAGHLGTVSFNSGFLKEIILVVGVSLLFRILNAGGQV